MTDHNTHTQCLTYLPRSSKPMKAIRCKHRKNIAATSPLPSQWDIRQRDSFLSIIFGGLFLRSGKH